MDPAHATSALAWIERSPLATAMRQELWLYPSIEILHILGFVTLVGSIAMFDLRLLGLSRELPVQQLARHLLPWTLGALFVIVPTGLMMFIAHASDFIANPAFIAKLTLIFVAGLNAVAFHLGPYRFVAQWDRSVASPFSARTHAALSLIIWMSVIACGRLLAYL
ncbi:MAG: hypothetical protein FJY54_10285 [Betaproteobacteria bacterium]|nr:hypothetical protein [Betaproteobacteria bacterium]